MALFRYATFLALLFSLPVALNLARDAHAVPVVWSGPTVTFTKSGADTADATDPLNQDRMTDNIWLTRGAVEGMFNIAQGHEDNYVRFTSPDDTLWATSVMPANSGKTISAALWQDQNLSFTTWAAAYGGPGLALGTNITTHNAVVHLLTDDIYLDLTFTLFTSGGEYTYVRSTPAVTGPTGDYNGNHTVDAADYVIWRRTLGDGASPAGSGADGNSTSTIELGDHTYWRERFGHTVAGAGAGLTSIPEPATIPLGLQLIVVVVCMFRWRSVTTQSDEQNRDGRTRSQPVPRLRIINLCLVTGTTLFVSLACASPSAQAAFHLWQVKEVFSNADGSVQFIELFDEFNDEQFVGGRSLEANSDGVIKTFTIPSDLTVPPTTAGRHMLIATPGFGSLPGGVAPDFTFDQSTTPFAAPFFNPNASQIIITFTASASDIGFSGSTPPADGFIAFPKDGTHSITNTNLYDDPILVVGTNSPTNFNNQSGSVNLAVPEPAGGLLAIAVWSLLGLRLRRQTGVT